MTGKMSVWTRLFLLGAMSLVAVLTTFAGEARASCVVNGVGARVAVPRPHLAVPAGLRDFDGSNHFGVHGSVVGMWNAVFLIGDGPDVYDQTVQQFHSDGLEQMLSNGLPPALGNVCVGVWKQTGLRTFKLKHMAWNWTEDGKLAGTFIMEVELKVDRSGTSYVGSWKADSYDLSDNVIPDLHAEGVARGSRIGVD